MNTALLTFKEDTPLITVCIKGEGGWCLVRVPRTYDMAILHALAVEEAEEQDCLPPMVPSPDGKVGGCLLIFSVLAQDPSLYNKLHPNGFVPVEAR